MFFVDDSRDTASINIKLSLQPTLIDACCNALITDAYASSSLVYFPTNAIFTPKKEKEKCIVQNTH